LVELGANRKLEEAVMQVNAPAVGSALIGRSPLRCIACATNSGCTQLDLQQQLQLLQRDFFTAVISDNLQVTLDHFSL